MSGKRERPGLLERLRAIPHLFAKVTVLYCVAFASGASIWSLRILSRTGHDPANLLAIMLDGGHVAAINGAESFAKINTGQIQYHMIQGN